MTNKAKINTIETAAKSVFTLCAVLAVFAVCSITIYMVAKGTPAFANVGVSELLFGTLWKPTASNASYGIMYIILSSIVGTGASVLIGIPVGLFTAVFLTEISNKKLASVVQPAVELLAAIPSVIYGLLGLMILNPVMYKLEKLVFAGSKTHQFTGGYHRRPYGYRYHCRYRKQRDNPIENQAIFPDSHERIIEDEVFEKVQQIRQQRHRKTKSGRSSMFSGLVYCSDCGEKLYYGATNNYRTEGAFFDCSLHWKHKDKCGTHYIREKVLQQLVLQHIQMVTGFIYRHEAHFRQVMEQQLHAESEKQIAANRKALERSEKRISELKRLFIKIYEDNASGKLSDERFDMMSQTYEAEQKELEAEVIRLQKEIEVQETQIQNIEKFIQKAGQHVGIEELTPYVLHELVKAIYVDAPDKSSGKRRQHIHIQYDGLGFIPLNELLIITTSELVVCSDPIRVSTC